MKKRIKKKEWDKKSKILLIILFFELFMIMDSLNLFDNIEFVKINIIKEQFNTLNKYYDQLGISLTESNEYIFEINKTDIKILEEFYFDEYPSETAFSYSYEIINKTNYILIKLKNPEKAKIITQLNTRWFNYVNFYYPKENIDFHSHPNKQNKPSKLDVIEQRDNKINFGGIIYMDKFNNLKITMFDGDGYLYPVRYV